MAGSSGLKGQGLLGQGLRGFRGLGISTGENLQVQEEFAGGFCPASTSCVAFITLTAGAGNQGTRSADIYINWYTQAGGFISTSTGSTVGMAPGTTEQLSVIATSPSNAYEFQIGFNVLSCNSLETFAATEAEFAVGSSIPSWTPGGFTGNVTLEIQASYDGGITWGDLRFGASVTPSGNTAVVSDYESPFNILLSYRARAVSVQNGQTLTSAWCTVDTITVDSTYWWVIDPVNPTNAMMLMRVQITGGTVPPNQNSSITIDAAEQVGIFRGFGESVAFVVRGDIWADEFDLGLYFEDTAAWNTFTSIRNLQTTLLLKSDMEGDRYYVVLGGDRPAAIMSAADRHYEPQRGLTIHATPVAVP